MLKRICFALDLIDDPGLISMYEYWHQHVWPDIEKNIKDAGVQQLEIYRAGNRLFMIMEVDEHFNLAEKELLDAKNYRNQEWEDKMWEYQQSLPFAKPGEKWVLMKKIYTLS